MLFDVLECCLSVSEFIVLTHPLFLITIVMMNVIIIVFP